MISKELQKDTISFIHANGFPPDSYRNILNKLSENQKIDNFLLRPLWKKETDHREIKDWNIFCDDYESYLNKYRNKVIGLGHSIGGNIVLHTAIKKPDLFSKIILLDPTLYSPKMIFIWKIINFFNMQHRFLNLSRNTEKKTMIYNSKNEIFEKYRSKKIFKNINDDILMNYISSITNIKSNKVEITYCNKWEKQIYDKGLLKDNYIWKNIKSLSIPCLIIYVENSNAFPKESIDKIKKINKNIQFRSLKDLTHLFPLENPKNTTKLIIEFINKSH